MTEHSQPKTGKILISGFDRFGYLKRPNASSEIALPAIEEKYGELVETIVLPVARDIAAEQMNEAIKELDPAVVVMFGISAGRKVRLERKARNIQLNVLTPDNNGVRRAGRLDVDGPGMLESTLPLDMLYSRLSEADIPTKYSNDAGSFICNELMYRVLASDAERPEGRIPTGFIHLGNGLSDQLVEEASLRVVDELLKLQVPSEINQ